MEDRFRTRVWGIEWEMYIDDAQFEPDYDFLVNDKKYIPEQCTGVKDKNGKLIYEGDIVETHDYTTEHSQIVFDKGCYVLKSKDSAMYEHLSSYEEKCKIIGNIHENPELLEEQ